MDYDSDDVFEQLEHIEKMLSEDELFMLTTILMERYIKPLVDEKPK